MVFDLGIIQVDQHLTHFHKASHMHYRLVTITRKVMTNIMPAKVGERYL